AAAGTAGFVIGARTPKLDSQSESANLRGGAIVVRGVSHNTGAGVAQNVVIQVAVDLGGGLNIDVGSSTAAATGEGVGSANLGESADKAGNSLLGEATSKLGDVAAGADLPFQLAVDLGANPPNDLYYSSTFTFDAAKVADEQETAKRVGGTLTLTGFLRNSGAVPAASLVLSGSLLDAAGLKLASGAARVGSLP